MNKNDLAFQGTALQSAVKDPKESGLFAHAPTHQESALEIGPLNIFGRHRSREIIIRGVRPVSEDAKAEIDAARRSDGSLDFSRLSDATLHQIVGVGEIIARVS